MPLPLCDWCSSGRRRFCPSSRLAWRSLTHPVRTPRQQEAGIPRPPRCPPAFPMNARQLLLEITPALRRLMLPLSRQTKCGFGQKAAEGVAAGGKPAAALLGLGPGGELAWRGRLYTAPSSLLPIMGGWLPVERASRILFWEIGSLWIFLSAGAAGSPARAAIFVKSPV